MDGLKVLCHGGPTHHIHEAACGLARHRLVYIDPDGPPCFQQVLHGIHFDGEILFHRPYDSGAYLPMSGLLRGKKPGSDRISCTPFLLPGSSQVCCLCFLQDVERALCYADTVLLIFVLIYGNQLHLYIVPISHIH